MSNRPQNKGVRYKEIARDLAKRVVSGDLEQGALIHGRSTLAAYYRVSPETIRRALRLLQDYNVIEVTHGSGIKVVSRENAELYLVQADNEDDLFQVHDHLRRLLVQRDTLNQEIQALYGRIFAFAIGNVASHHSIGEMEIGEDSPLRGELLDPVKMWFEKALSVVAVKRHGRVIAPHQAGDIQCGDILITVKQPDDNDR